jgi:glycosyltransferase involved in cell wall biosynthesis
MPGRRLKVIGHGPEWEALKRNCPPNVELLGRQPQSVVETCLRSARALVFAAEEDFGIAPVEAQAMGTPVIAFARGGALETVLDGQTGVLFHEQSAASLQGAIERFEPMRFNAEVLHRNALRFSHGVFKRTLHRWVFREWTRFCAQRSMPVSGGEPRRAVYRRRWSKSKKGGLDGSGIAG